MADVFRCEGDAMEFSASVCGVQLRVFQLVSGLPQEAVHFLPLSDSVSLCIIVRRLAREHQFSAVLLNFVCCFSSALPTSIRRIIRGVFRSIVTNASSELSSFSSPLWMQATVAGGGGAKAKIAGSSCLALLGQDVSKQNEKTWPAHRVSTCYRSISAVGIFSATLCSHGLYRLERWILASWSGIREARNERL